MLEVLQCTFFFIAGILQDHVERRERDGVGWPKCFRFVLFLPGKIRQRKTMEADYSQH